MGVQTVPELRTTGVQATKKLKTKTQEVQTEPCLSGPSGPSGPSQAIMWAGKKARKMVLKTAQELVVARSK